MNLRRRYILAGAALASLGVLLAILWLRHTPEPRYKGIRFGVFLDEYWKNREMRKVAHGAMKEMGSLPVPYLISQMEKDPLREIMFRIASSMPAKIRSVFPDQKVYAHRQVMAALLLTEAGTNAVSALPVLLAITEAEGPAFTHNYIRAIGLLAPGTEYEDRAKKILLRVASEVRSVPDKEMRRMSYHFLGILGGDEVIPALIDGLQERGMAGTCIDSLVKLGTNAVPELSKLAALESGYVRPAGLALEKIERRQREDQARSLSSN